MSFWISIAWTWVWMGYTTARIHQHSGSFSRYTHSRLRYGAVWLFIFICWPLALSLYEERLAQWSKWRPHE
ncbi:hypothetical protein GRH13_001110 [Salmonella enterica subsp. enterica]|nr:hypothetical protein [Salmonella enterica subsp. enterica serovar Richmond]